MPFTESPVWQLAAIVEVPFDDRVQCQCRACGHTVYKRVHIIEWADGRVECWGQDCYERELGATPAGRTSKAIYGPTDGRRLTPEERELLRNNREQLIAKFREDRERRIEAEREREKALCDAKFREDQERRVQAEREREKTLRDARERRSLWHGTPRVRGNRLPLGDNVTNDLSRCRPVPIPVSTNSGWPLEREGTCKYCGKKTRDWQSFFGKTGMCVCHDCYRQGKLG